MTDDTPKPIPFTPDGLNRTARSVLALARLVEQLTQRVAALEGASSPLVVRR